MHIQAKPFCIVRKCYNNYLCLIAPVCFNTMDCEGVPVSDDSISFAQCCFGLSAVSFALPGRCSLCPTPSAGKIKTSYC